MAQTPDGYLWIGTRAGLARFDGVRFTVFNRSNESAFENSHVYALAVDDAGTLWIGTNGGGLIRYRDGDFHLLAANEHFPTGRITALEPGIDGDLWVGTYGGGLIRLRSEEVEIFDSKNSGLAHDVIFSLDSDGEGGIWIGTWGGGVHRFRDGRIEAAWTTANGLADDGIFAVHQAPGGELWIGSNRGLHRVVDDRIEIFTTGEGLSHDRILSLLVDRDGILWVGTYGGGLNRLVGQSFDHLDRSRRFPSDNIWSLFGDADGSLWAGTLGGGIVQLKDGPFVSYSMAEGLSSELVSSFFEDRDGVLWIGTRNNGLNRLDRGEIEHITAADGLPSNSIWTLTGDPSGTLWVGTSDAGVARLSPPPLDPPEGTLRDDRWNIWTTQDGLAGNGVFSLATDRHGGVWVGTNKGLNRFHDGHFELFTTADGLASDQIRSFHESRRGGLWIGTSGGLSHFDGESFTSYDTSDGLSSNNVWSVYEDDQGTLWLATSGGGLSRFKDGVFTNFTTREGFHDDDLTSILADEADNFWIGSSRGIVRIPRQNLEDFAAGRAELTFVTYDKRDGMKNPDCYGGEPAGLKTRDGHLWFSTVDGAVTVDPARVPVTPAPRTFIESAFRDGERLPTWPGPLTHDGRSYQFHFVAPILTVPDKIRLRFRLRGFEESWRPARPRQRDVQYNNLNPGAYTFEVMASDELGRFVGEAATFSFRITPPFYQTSLFYTLVAVAIVLVGYGLHHVRIRHYQLRESELAAKVRESLTKIKILGGLIPICLSCKKIRDDAGYWEELETYIGRHSEASFSHGICPKCVAKLYPEFSDKVKD